MPVAYSELLCSTLPRVRHVIAAAAASVGRDPQTVRLIAVTKGHPLAALRAALAAGLSDLGENRIEELAEKVAALRAAEPKSPVNWHLVGHVQSRKARSAAQLADLVHSVDSVRLAERMARAAREAGLTARVLVQVNTSGEAAKHGLPTAGAQEEVLRMAELSGLRVEGLMTMAPRTTDQTVLTTTFARLRELRDRLVFADERVGAELSMGMSNDLAVAVREGSTMVRVGTALFGQRG